MTHAEFIKVLAYLVFIGVINAFLLISLFAANDLITALLLLVLGGMSTHVSARALEAQRQSLLERFPEEEDEEEGG